MKSNLYDLFYTYIKSSEYISTDENQHIKISYTLYCTEQNNVMNTQLQSQGITRTNFKARQSHE